MCLELDQVSKSIAYKIETYHDLVMSNLRYKKVRCTWKQGWLHATGISHVQ